MLPIPLQPPSQSGTGDRSRPDYHREPFRLFFPLAVLIGWIGVGHWLLYALGVTSSFSGFMHGQLMMQAFMMAFALGFLLTAVPRRTQGPWRSERRALAGLRGRRPRPPLGPKLRRA
jgi:uncharacterized protein involved in response to NO